MKISNFLRAALAASSLWVFLASEENPLSGSGEFRYETGVFYFPFGTNTYQAITESMILKCADLTSLEQANIKDIVDTGKRAKGSTRFLEGAVRLRIIFPGKEEYIVDNQGCVKHLTGKDRHIESVGKLLPQDLVELHRKLMYPVPESDVR